MDYKHANKLAVADFAVVSSGWQGNRQSERESSWDESQAGEIPTEEAAEGQSRGRHQRTALSAVRSA